MSNSLRSCALLALSCGFIASSASAAVVFTGSQGTRAASVTFDVQGTTLVATLRNTSTADVMVPTDLLTALFFDVSGPTVNLTRESAILAAGSVVHFDDAPAGGVVGGEWAYKASLSGAPGNGGYGISSTGIDFFGPGDRFPGANLEGPNSPGGMEYGLASVGDNPATGNAPVTGGNALIQDGVVFRLAGLPANFDLARIGNVTFLYGTEAGGPTIPGIPAPASGLIAGAGLLALMRRRR